VASIDGQATPVYADAAGEIFIAPRGRTGVATLRFTRPAYVRFSTLLSCATAAAGAVLLIIAAARRRRGRHESAVRKESN
jgi:hypothetical protein